MTLHVLLITGRLGPGSLGQVADLIASLSGVGCDVRLVCLGLGESQDLGVEVIECRGLGVPWRRDLHARWLGFADGWVPSLIYVLGLGQSEVGLALAERWRQPYLIEVDEFPPAPARLRVSRNWFRGLIAISHDVANDLSRELGIPPSWISVIPPGIQISPGEPGSGNVTLSGAGSGTGRIPVIGTALTPGADPGTLDFLSAARALLDQGIDVEFLIAARGQDESALRRAIARLQLVDRVTFAEQESVGNAFWSVFDVYCQPATRPSGGRILGEAMAHAVPVVATDVAGLRNWVIPERTGCLVPPGKPDDLARTILDLLRDPPRAHLLGEEARRWISEACDLPRHAQAMLFHFRRALEQGLPP